MKKRIMAVLLAVFVMAGSVPCLAADVQAEEAAEPVGLDAEYHTQEEIREYYQNHPICNMEAEYLTEPSVTIPYALGELTEETKQDALNLLNLLRYIAGVPLVSISDTAQNYAQAAALVCAINRELSHSASHPEGIDDETDALAVYGAANSNLSVGGNVLNNTLVRYMQDTLDMSDGNFGHRRQLLDYCNTEAGFGMVKSKAGPYYSATFVDANIREDKVISYPGQNQPLEYFGTEYAWTVIVPEKVDASTINVRLTDMRSDKVWDYSQGSKGFQMDISRTSTCVIFTPYNIEYRDGDRYKVEITGIHTPISYEVNMFLLNAPVPLQSLKSSVRTFFPYEGDSSYICSVDYIPENATNKIVTWSSSDPDIAEPIWMGTGLCGVDAKKAGTAVFTATSDDGGHTVTVEIVVRPKAETLTLNASDITIGVGQYFELEGMAFPKESKDSVYFKADYDKNIISCEETGYGNRVKITGRAVGKTSISAYAYSDRSVTAVCNINVVEPVYTTELRLGETQMELMEGDTVQLVPSASPDNITCRDLEWSSSNSNVIKIDQGRVSACGAGTAVVTVKALDGSGKEAQCTFTVYGNFDCQHRNKELRGIKEASCLEDGYTGDTYCKDCGMELFTGKSVKALGHDYVSRMTKEPTVIEEGVMTYSCNRCQDSYTESLPRLPNKDKDEEQELQPPAVTAKNISKAVVELSEAACNYDGKEQKPAVKAVRLGQKILNPDTDYTVKYINNVNIGTASVIITGKGRYTGTVTKNFSINAQKGSYFTVGAYKYQITGSSEAAFAGLKSSKAAKVTIPKTVEIGGRVFKVTSVAQNALKKTKVTSVSVGANVTSIGTSAFEGCTRLFKVTIGSKVTMIGANAFKNCKRLGAITIKSAKLKSVGKNALEGIKATVKIKVPAKKLSAYKKLFKNKGQGKKAKVVK